MFCLYPYFFRCPSTWVKCMFRILIMLFNCLLTQLDNCACCATELLAVFCILVVVHGTNSVLPACRFGSCCTCARAACFSCCSCCSWPSRSWNLALLGVGPWLHAGAMPLHPPSWHCSGILWITTSMLHSACGASTPVGGECRRNDGSSPSGACCHPWKL